MAYTYRRLGFLVLLGTMLHLSAFVAFGAGKLQNPVAPDGADPWVTYYEGSYYYCYSTDEGILVNKAPKLQDVVQQRGKVIWKPSKGLPYSEEIWAPELHFIDGRWFVYFAADDGNNENHAMYVLESKTEDACGKFIFRGKIAASKDTWAIDGTVLVHKGKMYFVWSGWEGDANGQQNLYIAPMKDPRTISGK